MCGLKRQEMALKDGDANRNSASYFLHSRELVSRFAPQGIWNASRFEGLRKRVNGMFELVSHYCTVRTA